MPDTSLRTPRRAQTRKPTIAPSITIGQPIPRNAKARVDDRIKKRMSMRYAELLASPTDVNAVPPIPGLPSPSGPEGIISLTAGMDLIADNSRGAGARLLDDKRLLEDERFDPDAFLKVKLANSTEAELRSLESSLQSVKNDTNSDLQRNVFKNYAEFVLVSKEITSLETEMLELKDLLSEYRSMPSVLHIPDPTSQSLSSNVASTYKRSSVADLRIMYYNQMQELHAHIEGSAKFAPTTPGRHVVAEIEGLLSLNAATYKVVGRVRFVVLDDLVLVARRRRRKTTTSEGGGGGSAVNGGKLVAERCWPLSEMLVLDTKDSARMTNVFKIRHGKETHVYRTENAQDKKALLAQFQHVAGELAAKKRKEREGEHERRKSLWQGGGDRSSYAAMPEWTADLAARGDDMESGAKEKAERDAQWVGDWADDLTVAIALREWDKGVLLIEEGKAKMANIPILAHKLPPLKALLTKSLLSTLSLPSARKSVVVSLISYLLRLEAGSAARTTFLQMRTKVLKSHVRKIKLDGNIGSYVGDLAVVYFTGIKHTADWFLASFKENEVASSFIDWTKCQIEDFARHFRKQVFTTDVEPEIVRNALNISYAQSKKLLQEFGLDFRFLLQELLVANPKENKSTPQISFTHPPPQPIIEPVPVSRRRTPAVHIDQSASSSSTENSIAPPSRPKSNVSSPSSPNSLPPLQMDNLVPPSSALSKRSAISPTGNSPFLSAASGYTSNSNYSRPTAGANDPPELLHTSISTAPLRTKTPLSAVPRSRTPVSPAPPRPRTPVSAAPLRTVNGLRTPASAAVSTNALLAQQEVPLASPIPRRVRSPPPSAFAGGRERREGDEILDRERDRPPTRSRDSPAPPPKSTNRPVSTQAQRPPQRDGMF